MEIIKLEYKKVFGNDLYYPACNISDMIINMMSRSAFTPQQVKKLQTCYTVELLQPQLSL